MPLRIVQSKQNARLKELRRALARPGRDDRGLVAIEGPHLVEEALIAGLRIECAFVATEKQHLMDGLALDDATDILLVPSALLEAVLQTEAPQGMAALVQPPEWTWAHLLGTARAANPLVVVLAGLQDPGNLGTILRSAEAFGASGVVSLPGSVSPWNSKAVRASAGSVFRLPLISSDVEECFAALQQAGARIFATDVHQAAPAQDMNLTGPVALIIGNEGSGVPRDLAARADARITIPCPGPVESLNAAVAASILLYEASRQRAAVSSPSPALRGAAR